ncbi:hypothetical protein G7Y89_g10600 [Cudoniella acicularis]|uniref:Uncharacterized protein n=1 Tax=Cudoniella acicularis TaxID=354080 RepID=A0A8H4RCF6_9HELO|nr:hypothetical protein G7Y89_g10600 [Cudoniella acicularis]
MSSSIFLSTLPNKGESEAFILNIPPEVHLLFVEAAGQVAGACLGLTCKELKAAHKRLNPTAIALDTIEKDGGKQLWEHLEASTKDLVYDSFPKKLVTIERQDDLVEARQHIRAALKATLRADRLHLRQTFVRNTAPLRILYRQAVQAIKEQWDEIEKEEALEQINLQHSLEREQVIIQNTAR